MRIGLVMNLCPWDPGHPRSQSEFSLLRHPFLGRMMPAPRMEPFVAAAHSRPGANQCFGDDTARRNSSRNLPSSFPFFFGSEGAFSTSSPSASEWLSPLEFCRTSRRRGRCRAIAQLYTPQKAANSVAPAAPKKITCTVSLRRASVIAAADPSARVPKGKRRTEGQPRRALAAAHCCRRPPSPPPAAQKRCR